MALTMTAAAGCTQNLFGNLVDKTSDSYRLDEAKKDLDNFDFNNAILNIAPVVVDEPKSEDVVTVAASAYSGRAGLRIIDLVSELSTKLGKGESILQVFAEHYIGATAQSVTDIETAVSIIETYGAKGVDRSSNVNLLAVFVYFSRIGVNLNLYAYDPTADTLLTNFRACHTTVDHPGATTGLPDPAVDIIMTSIPRILDAIAGLATAQPALSSFKNFQSDLPPALISALSFTPIPCASDSDNSSCLGVRSVVAQGPSEVVAGVKGMGLGTGETACATTSP